MSYIGNTNTTQGFVPAIDYFSGNGSTTSFTLSRPVASVAQIQAVVNNVAQNPTSAYTVSGNTITFTSAPSSGTNNIYVYYTSPITQTVALPQDPQVFGDLQFNSLGARIIGDFNNATIANRVAFQTINANSGTVITALPNGTSITSQVVAVNASDPTDAALAQMFINSSEVSFRSAKYGTGTYLPMTFYTSGSEKMRIDTSGNVGIGQAATTPIALLHVGVSEPGDEALRLSWNGGGTSQGYASIGFSTSLSATQPNASIRGEETDTSDYRGNLVFSTRATNVDTDAPTERMRIDSSGYATGAVNGNGSGIIQANQYYRLNSGLAGSNGTGAQSVLGAGVTLVGSTVYEFEIYAVFVKSAGTTSHNFQLGFGGTATNNNILHSAHVVYGNGALPGQLNLALGIVSNGTTATTLVTTATAAIFMSVIWKGTISVNTGGTLIPQYTLSAAPGGAYTTQAGSYIKISALSASGSNTSIGTWA